MLRCEECGDLLLDLAYDLLDPGETLRVREHLESCPDCKAAFQLALRQKMLLARAAFACPVVPEFSQPCDEAPAEIAPVTLPLAPTAPKPRRPVRLAWIAAAAAFFLVVFPAYYYWHGLSVRHGELVQLRRDVADVDDQYASIVKDFQKRRLYYAALETRQELRLEVTGPSVYDPTVDNAYHVVTKDLAGQELSGLVAVRLVDAASNRVLWKDETAIRGGRSLRVPANLSVSPQTKARLEIRASAGSATDTVEEVVTPVPDAPLTQLTLNKRLYHVGEIVFFRSVTLERYTLRPPEKPLRLQQALRDPQGKTVVSFTTATGPGGIASGELALTKDLAEGDYTLQIADEAGRAVATQPLRVAREVPANLSFHRQRYRPGDKVVASYQSRRLENGVAMGNQAVTVKVLQDDGKMLEGLRQPMQLYTNAQGQANIEFNIPRLGADSPFNLEIQLNEDKSKEKLVREIPLAVSPPEVEFFPEGGELLAGAANRVYFRATTKSGEPADLEGRVVDSRGESVAEVRTEAHDAVRGLGAFNLTPRSGENYRLQITSPAGVKSSPALPAARQAGVSLSVENPVEAEGDAIHVVLNSYAEKSLLLVADCRGRSVAQQYLTASAGTTRASLTPAAGARGTLRVTVYELGAGGVTPLAERLVFRDPNDKLVLSASTKKFAYLPGESVGMTVNSADEKGKAAPAWLAALVVDERVLPDDSSADQSMPAFFYLLNDVGRPRDLDNADVLLAPGDQARRALDLFLGTHGWRRFVPAAAPAEKVAWFHRDNRDSALKRHEQELAAARSDLESRRLKAEEMRERGEGLRNRAQVAFLELSEFEQWPRQLLGIGLGVVVVALVLAGAGLLLWGLATLARGGAARTHLLVAMVLLGCCLAALLAFGNRPAPGDRQDALAWVQSKIQPFDLVVPQEQQKVRPEQRTDDTAQSVKRPLAEEPSGGGGGLKDLTQKAADQKVSAVKDVYANLARNADRDLPSSNFRMNLSVPQNYDAAGMGEPLQARFKDVAREQAAAARSTRLDNPVPTSAPTGGVGGMPASAAESAKSQSAGGKASGPPPVMVTPATANPVPPPAEMKQGGGGLNAPDGVQQNLDNSLRQREYAHKHTRKDNDFQDTVFWHSALFTQGGEVRVEFDLSSVPTSYRVLLYGNTADGRLGGFQGRLTTRTSGSWQPVKR
jgi:hypothetical protein